VTVVVLPPAAASAAAGSLSVSARALLPFLQCEPEPASLTALAALSRHRPASAAPAVTAAGFTGAAAAAAAVAAPPGAPWWELVRSGAAARAELRLQAAAHAAVDSAARALDVVTALGAL
jgi:hypothetical protein